MDRRTAANGLQLLCEALEDRKREIADHLTSGEEVSDDKADAGSPVFDSFHCAGGSEGIMKMTSFTPSEFHGIGSTIEGYVSEHWIVFMMITVLKHGGVWDLIARIFGIKGPKF